MKNKIFTIHDRVCMYHLLEPPDSWYLNGITYYDEIEYRRALEFAYKSSLARGLSKKVKFRDNSNSDLLKLPIPAEFSDFSVKPKEIDFSWLDEKLLSLNDIWQEYLDMVPNLLNI